MAIQVEPSRSFRFVCLIGVGFFTVFVEQALADVSTCTPPEMHFPFPKAPLANKWEKMAGAPTKEVCVAIPSNKAVSEAHCFVEVIIVVPGETRPDYYQCESNKACAGKGTFSSVQRRPSGKVGTDLFCTTFTNQADTDAAGLRVKLDNAPKAAQPKLLRAPR